jgi:hypothetical protein
MINPCVVLKALEQNSSLPTDLRVHIDNIGWYKPSSSHPASQSKMGLRTGEILLIDYSANEIDGIIQAHPKP